MDSSISKTGYKIPKPETGLAEWTSKIKALQREVDADEEAEQKRLEEEIAAAREARLRRSRGMGAVDRVDSPDMSMDKRQLSFPKKSNDASANDTPQYIGERKNDQDTALRKLMERNDVYIPDKFEALTSEKDPVSLASFIGGRATGPRLNRHAPQQDAHDPTMFIQRDRTTPHPIFGTGGVAMPGMVAKLPSPAFGTENSERYQPSSSTARSVSSVASSYLEKVDSNKRENPDTQRHSYTGVPKSVSPSVVQKQDNKTEVSANRNLSANASNETLRSRNTFNPNPRSISTSTSSSYVPKIEQPPVHELRTLSLTKRDDTFRSNQNSFTPKPISPPTSPSYLPNKEDITARNTFPEKSAETIRPNLNAFSSTPKSTLSSYLPRKEDESLVPTKPADAFRAAVSNTTSKTLPSYTGATTTTKLTSGKVAPASTPGTPLRRLMEQNNVHNPDDQFHKSVAERAQTVSLAAFMGGSAAGPRLNRHAPQQDAHDPTQFTQPDTNAPHPIFGRGGVAMPGLASRNSKNTPNDSIGSENSERYRPSSTTKVTWPPVTSTPTDKAKERPVSPQKTGNRARTTSAPGTQLPNVSSSQYSGVRFSSNKADGRQSPTKDSRATRDRTISGPSYPQSSSSLSSYSSRSSVTTDSSVRPIQPIPKSVFSPQLPITVPSPAFQKPPPQKDLTPSISRLQGRGFVRNMVKASHYETQPSSPPSSEKSRPSSDGRRGSVLDRWQPIAGSVVPTNTNVPTYTTAMKQPATQEPAITSIEKQHLTNPSTIKPSASMPSLANAASTATPRVPVEGPATTHEPFQRSRTPGLGSATTMVLIKPTKSSSDLTQPPVRFDEHGMKYESRQGVGKESTQSHIPSEIPPSSRKPLIHPTKDRARKPRRHQEILSPPDSGISRLTDSSQPQGHPLIWSHQLKETTTDQPMLPTPYHNVTRNGKDDDMTSRAARYGSGTAITSTSTLTSTEFTLPPQNTDQVAHVSLGRRFESTLSPMLEPGVEFAVPKTPETSLLSLASPPNKHVRTPSAGSRLSAMEVAQILTDHPVVDSFSNNSYESASLPQRGSFVESTPTKPQSNISQLKAEKRKSSYEKYSAIILPSLKEEATPAPSPAGTLTRTTNRQDNSDVKAGTIQITEVGSLGQEVEPEPPSNSTDNIHDKAEHELPFPDVDLGHIFKSTLFHPSKPSDDVEVISIDVLVITGTSATALSKALDIFYDSEILTIIHRTKSKSSGLASTSVWCWLGRRSMMGDREQKKVHELAKRYGTNAKMVHQLAEPSELIWVLGGRLAIRQGTRTHWTSENTTMHLVRSLRGVIVIDEHDLNVKNLCSAFSYCVTFLGSVFIWHGCGSTIHEREAALQYAETFSADAVTPIVLLEGEDDDDEMFWTILGDDDFAKADYWQWRKAAPVTDPSICKLDLDNSSASVIAVEFISMDQDIHKSIYIVNCLWEFFIVIGKEAQSNKRAIAFAIDLAKKMSNDAASSKPYAPTVHVLILPSQIPLDLRLGIRDLDEAWVNDGEIPDHINLLRYSEAVNHLSTDSWGQVAIKD